MKSIVLICYVHIMNAFFGLTPYWEHSLIYTPITAIYHKITWVFMWNVLFRYDFNQNRDVPTNFCKTPKSAILLNSLGSMSWCFTPDRRTVTTRLIANVSRERVHMNSRIRSVIVRYFPNSSPIFCSGVCVVLKSRLCIWLLTVPCHVPVYLHTSTSSILGDGSWLSCICILCPYHNLLTYLLRGAESFLRSWQVFT